MAIGQSVQQLGPIDPSSLIGRADRTLVEPKATAALIDSFRQGVITADDIVNRIGQLGQSKKKAEIDIAGMQSMQAQEAMSPEAVAARAQALATQSAVGATAQAQAERTKILTQYPAVAYFDKLAAAAGITEPKNADGTPDYPQMEKIGAELAVQQARKAEAATELANIEHDRSANGEILFSRTKQGLPVDSLKVRRLQDIASSPLSRQAPGTAQVAPAVEARATPVAAEVGSPVAGGFSLGAPKAATPVDPTERAQAIAVTEALLPQIAEARAAVKRGTGVGPVEGSAGAKIFNTVGSWFGARKEALKDQRDLTILVSQKILEGAQGMKGNLSDRDVQFLKDIVPKLSDQEATWNTFFDRWESMTKVNRDILSGKIAKPTGDLFAPADYDPAATAAKAAATATAYPKVKSAAEVATLPANVQFFLTPDGRPKKNPNFRP